MMFFKKKPKKTDAPSNSTTSNTNSSTTSTSSNKHQTPTSSSPASATTSNNNNNVATNATTNNYASVPNGNNATTNSSATNGLPPVSTSSTKTSTPASAPQQQQQQQSNTANSNANVSISTTNSKSSASEIKQPSTPTTTTGKVPIIIVNPSSSSSAAASSANTSMLGRAKPTLLTVKSLKDTPAADRPMVFQNHLILCQQMFNFADTSAQMREKEAKRQLLLGLVDYTNGTKDVFTESILPDVISMLSANLFRDIPVRESEGIGDDEEPMLEPSWPHLQIVYEFLLRFVVSSDVDAKVAKKYISQQFIIQLLELFNSEDPRERDYLKTILHRIYGKYMALRAFIRRAINNVFYRVMYYSDRHNGIGELLEILGSIINGFALPLKAEHKKFLVNALIPLHKVKSVGLFHQQLAYCITQFVEKDPKMVEPIILGLLRFWPSSSSPKQVLFLNELEDILELVQPAEFTKIMVPLFKRIDLCLDSPHFQVAERTLFLWNNEYVVSLISQNKRELLPILISTIVRNADSHWNATVKGLTGNVLKLFQEMDKSLYNECKSGLDADRRKKIAIDEDRQKKWQELEQLFAQG